MQDLGTHAPYNKKGKLSGFFRLLISRRGLLEELVARDLRDAYQGSSLSRWWALIHPLLIIGLYLFVFGHVFVSRVSGNLPKEPDFAVYLLCGLSVWLSVQTALMKATNSLVGASNLVKQVVFPIELLPVRSVLSSQVPLLLGVVVVAVYSFANYGVISPLLPLIIPVIALQILLLVGVGLFFAALTVFIRDTRDIMQIFTTVGMFVAPIIYMPGSLPSWFETLLFFNPFSYAIWCVQDIFFFQSFTKPSAWLALLIAGPISLWLGVTFFERTRQNFGDAL